MNLKRGRCCVARYAGGPFDKSQMDRIMLKFRPIAPKPASADRSVSGGTGGSPAPERGRARPKNGRGKGRREARNRRSNCCSRRKPSTEKEDPSGSVSGGEKDARTLWLLPEEPGVMENRKISAPNRSYPLWLSFGDEGGSGISADQTEMERSVVQSWVKVERVMDAWVAVGKGCTDEEKLMWVHQDTCPGFVSDGMNRVMWTNAAYQRMVAEEGAEVVVWVVVERGVVLPAGCAGFTCRARVETCGKEKGAKTVPCDVWSMDCGGFAWRLDTMAALSLWVGQ